MQFLASNQSLEIQKTMVWQPCWMTERFVLSSNMAATPLLFWISRDWLQTKNMQYIGETKRHLSGRFGEHRRTIKKAIQRRHINQPTAVSDHFTLPGHSINNIELIPLDQTKSKLISLYSYHYRAKLLRADWLRERAFFVNQGHFW